MRAKTMVRAIKSPFPAGRGVGERGSNRFPLILVRGSLAWISLAGMFFCALATQAAGEGSYVIEGSKAEKLDSCVEPTDFMRRNHMEVIEHQRDETVHKGIRSTNHSLAGCIDCHVGYDQQRQPVPVYADGQFCRNCHEFAAVDMNCFDCHAGVPVHPTGDPIRSGSGQKVGLSTGSPERPDGARDVKQGVGE